MRLPERLLLFLSSRDLEKTGTDDEWDTDNSLNLLARYSPNFFNDIKGKKILDFGCGTGFQTISLVLNGASFVVGVDINQNRLEKARKLAQDNNVEDKVMFASKLDDNHPDHFDIVLSHNSFEHFDNPVAILEEMKLKLKNNGRIYISFGPPWYAPYGVHNFFFVRIPWANILFSEKTIINVRCLYTKESVTAYEEIGLNKMTIRKLEDLIAASGMELESLHYEAVKGINFLSKIPSLRELFINHVHCVIFKRG